MGTAHPWPLPPARRRSGQPRHVPGRVVRRFDRGRDRAGRADQYVDAVPGNGPPGQLRHRGVDERHPPGRGFTGRDVIVKFAGCYHGHVDSLLVAAGSSATTLGVPNSPGVPKGAADTLVLRFNDVEVCSRRSTHRTRIAGVILEPIVGNMGLVIPNNQFLSELRRLTQHRGLLIYDEVITGFRVGLGGSQGCWDRRPI